MRSRTAFVIASALLALIIFTGFMISPPSSVREVPVVYAQPRTDLLPPIPAPPVVPTTTTTTAPPPTTTTTVTPTAGPEGIPAAWWPTALCEEGGRDDPNYGYFGIQEWNGFDGYPTAGSAPLSVQLAWESYVGQITPPDAPGQCHGY